MNGNYGGTSCVLLFNLFIKFLSWGIRKQSKISFHLF